MANKTAAIKSTADLRRMLIDTIGEVRKGKIDVSQARTIATLSTTVLHSAKLDLEYLRFRASTKQLEETGERVLALVSP